MTEIDYGRLDQLEAALGGRAAIEAAYQAGHPLVGSASYLTIQPDNIGIRVRGNVAGSPPMLTVPSVAGLQATLDLPSRTLDAGEGIGFPQPLLAIGAGVPVRYLELTVFNADFSQVLVIGSNSFTVPVVDGLLLDQSLFPPENSYGQVGSDLSIATSGNEQNGYVGVISAAGGAFFARVYVQTAPT